MRTEPDKPISSMICFSSVASAVARVGSTSASRRIAAVNVPRGLHLRNQPRTKPVPLLRWDVAAHPNQNGVVGGWQLCWPAGFFWKHRTLRSGWLRHGDRRGLWRFEPCGDRFRQEIDIGFERDLDRVDVLTEPDPKLAELMDGAESDVLAYMSFPPAHRPKLHSTNSDRAPKRRDQAPHRGHRHLPQ